MQAAPITAAATPAGTGADANAPGATDLFAGLMAGLFNPAQATPPTAAAIGMQAEAGDGGLIDCQGVDLPEPLQPAAGKPDLTAHLTRERLVVGDLDGRIRKDPEVLPGPGPVGGETLPAEPVVLPALPSKGSTADLAKPAPTPAPADARAAQALQIAARPEVVSVKAQTVEAPAAPSPALLQAAQMQGQGLQPARPVAAADAGNLRPTAARPIKTSGPATSAQGGPALKPASLEDALADDLEALEASNQRPDGGLPPELAAQAEARSSMSALAQPVLVRGSPHTVAHLSAEIARKLEAQSTRFQVELEPAGMGRVDVRVEIGAGGALNASLNFDNAHSAEAMRARSGELHAALEQAGFDLGGGLSFTAGGAGHRQAGQDERQARADLARDRAPPPAADGPPPIAVAAARPLGPGRLDIRI